jgi:hypothetical protein
MTRFFHSHKTVLAEDLLVLNLWTGGTKKLVVISLHVLNLPLVRASEGLLEGGWEKRTCRIGHRSA